MWLERWIGVVWKDGRMGAILRARKPTRPGHRLRGRAALELDAGEGRTEPGWGNRNRRFGGGCW